MICTLLPEEAEKLFGKRIASTIIYYSRNPERRRHFAQQKISIHHFVFW
jgi:hypothetical protein